MFFLNSYKLTLTSSDNRYSFLMQNINKNYKTAKADHGSLKIALQYSYSSEKKQRPLTSIEPRAGIFLGASGSGEAA